MRSILVKRLINADYAETWDLQRQIQQDLIADKRSDNPQNLPHQLLLVEHPHVYTLGKSGSLAHLLLNEEKLAAEGATFHKIDRGGDITYHGFGQLVGYPILDLDDFFTDIGRYLRNLEECIILTCADYGVQAGRVAGRTGVWLPATDTKPERKICAMGIKCSRWVTMHGFAFNLNTDLRFFDYIVPCGITDAGVTSLHLEIGEKVDENMAISKFLGHFETIFERKCITNSAI
jgi:lipoyl(octanoyl) transferase